VISITFIGWFAARHASAATRAFPPAATTLRPLSYQAYTATISTPYISMYTYKLYAGMTPTTAPISTTRGPSKASFKTTIMDVWLR